jgi:cell division protein ZapA (FtsZ GTPase activity inhibitor)
MNKVKFSVAGKEYTISTSKEPAYVYALARELDKRLRDNLVNGASAYTAAILTSLSCLSDVKEIRENFDEILNEARSYVDAAGRDRIKNDTLEKENAKLRLKLEQTEKELNELKRVAKAAGIIKNEA